MSAGVATTGGQPLGALRPRALAVPSLAGNPTFLPSSAHPTAARRSCLGDTGDSLVRSPPIRPQGDDVGGAQGTVGGSNARGRCGPQAPSRGPLALQRLLGRPAVQVRKPGLFRLPLAAGRPSRQLGHLRRVSSRSPRPGGQRAAGLHRGRHPLLPPLPAVRVEAGAVGAYHDLASRARPPPHAGLLPDRLH